MVGRFLGAGLMTFIEAEKSSGGRLSRGAGATFDRRIWYRPRGDVGTNPGRAISFHHVSYDFYLRNQRPRTPHGRGVRLPHHGDSRWCGGRCGKDG